MCFALRISSIVMKTFVQRRKVSTKKNTIIIDLNNANLNSNIIIICKCMRNAHVLLSAKPKEIFFFDNFSLVLKLQ